MIRNFLSGIVFGGVIAGLGLAVISQVTPMPAQLDQAANSDQAPVAEAVAEPVAEPVAESVAVADPAPAAEPVPEPADEPEPAPAVESEAVAPKPADPAPPVLNDLAPATPAAPAEANDMPEVAQPGDAAPETPVLAAKPVLPAADQPQVSPDLPPAAVAETAEPLLTPPAEPAPVPATDLAIDAPAEAPLVQDASPTPPTEAPPADLATALPDVPEPGLNKTVEGVTTGRLPTISAADPAPVADAPPAEVPPADPRPIVQFARSFSNDSGKPAFAVVLIDNGAADLDRAALAALPFPVSFVIDPLDPSAPSAAAAYRAGGQEVIMLASGIPRGANPSDLEQTFQSNAQVLPETVAVMDIGAGGFQDDGQLAAQVVPLIKAQGRGLLTFDRGLNAADQVAQREGVESAVIFRELDAEAEDPPLIRRYLDRAAFKAAQEGRVVVLGTTRPETIAALMEWTVEGRAASVALAPLTAVLVAQ